MTHSPTDFRRLVESPSSHNETEQHHMGSDFVILFFSAIIVAPYRETLIFHIFELSRDYRSEFDLSRRRALLLCWKCTKLYERSSDTRKKMYIIYGKNTAKTDNVKNVIVR